MAPNPRDDTATAMLQTGQQLKDAVTEGISRDPTMQRLPPAREREAFWERAVSPEDELLLWAQGLDPWEISAKVYPKRWQMMSMGRPTAHEQATWFEHHRDQGPPAHMHQDGTRVEEAPSPTIGPLAPASAGMPAPAGPSPAGGMLPQPPQPPAPPPAPPGMAAAPASDYPSIDSEVLRG